MHQSHCEALGHNFLEQLLEHIRFLEAPMAILRKRGVMGNLLVKAETSEPALRKVHAQLLDKLALTADPIHRLPQPDGRR
jgi:hypothetical protein